MTKYFGEEALRELIRLIKEGNGMDNLQPFKTVYDVYDWYENAPAGALYYGEGIDVSNGPMYQGTPIEGAMCFIMVKHGNGVASVQAFSSDWQMQWTTHVWPSGIADWKAAVEDIPDGYDPNVGYVRYPGGWSMAPEPPPNPNMKDKVFGVQVPVGAGQVLQYRTTSAAPQSYNATWPLYVELYEYSMQYDAQSANSFYLAMLISLNFSMAGDTVYASCDVLGHIPGNSQGIQISNPRVDAAITSNRLGFNIRDISAQTAGRTLQMYVRAANSYPFDQYSGAEISLA
ncbi:MAG: hypothetical protein FWE80_08310 [Oscillospiraceae bacterium]|nr:hypothetical protein [Oscillospiraceae bacterium]